MKDLRKYGLLFDLRESRTAKGIRCCSSCKVESASIMSITKFLFHNQSWTMVSFKNVEITLKKRHRIVREILGAPSGRVRYKCQLRRCTLVATPIPCSLWFIRKTRGGTSLRIKTNTARNLHLRLNARVPYRLSNSLAPLCPT